MNESSAVHVHPLKPNIYIFADFFLAIYVLEVKCESYLSKIANFLMDAEANWVELDHFYYCRDFHQEVKWATLKLMQF